MSQTLKKALQSYQQGDFSAALALARQAVEQDRVRSQDIQALIGNCCVKLGRMLEAGDAFAEAAAFSTPKSPLMSKFAINLYQTAGARDRILSAGARAVEQNPADRDTIFAYASALFSSGRLPEVAPLIDRLDPAIPAHNALIINHHRLTGNFEYLSQALEAAVCANPADILSRTARYIVAREICDFPVLEEHAHLMDTPDTADAIALMTAEPALGRLYWCASEALQIRPSSSATALSAVPFSPRRAFSADGPIRIGYLSNDFHDHATMRLFLHVLHAHDPQIVDVTIFSYTDHGHEEWRNRHFPKHLLDRIVPLGGMTDADAAAVVSQHGTDILVDLKGHTMGARLGIVNLSDAPLKVTWLGYPGSVTGVDLDYVICDPVVTPDTSRPFFHEKLCRLPETYQCNDAVHRPLPPVPSRASLGLPENAFVFASFNAAQKLNPETVRLWARALAAVPGSVLWLMCEKQIARRNLEKAFAALGIGAERIVFTGHTNNHDHLARMGAADLGLDTFPYNGHTTTSDMLWMGLPVLTLKGGCFAARVSESLLNAAGMPGLSAADEDHFVEIAVSLATDPARLSALRARLEEGRFTSPLFDGERFTRHLEDAYTLMAARARSRAAPDHLDIPARPPRARPFLVRPRKS